jgi:hypothetical protein
MASVKSTKLFSDDVTDKGKPLTRVRIIFPDSLDQLSAKISVLTETSFELSLGSTEISDRGTGGQLKVGLQRFYDLPIDTNIEALLDDVDAASQKGILAEEKIKIEGKISRAKDIEAKTTETYFDMEVILPPGQNLPEHFYLSLLRGDIPNAFGDISEDTSYTMKVHQTVKSCDEPLDVDMVDKTKEGKISQLEEEWDEMFSELEMT